VADANVNNARDSVRRAACYFATEPIGRMSEILGFIKQAKNF
jgi:hypothetical protein